MSEPMSDEEAAARHAEFQAAIADTPRRIEEAAERDAELRPVQSSFSAGYSGGPDCPCADDPYGCDGVCIGS